MRAVIAAVLLAACVEIPTPVGTAGQSWECSTVLICGGVADETTRETVEMCGPYADSEPASEQAALECRERHGCAAEHWCHADCTSTGRICVTATKEKI